MLNEFKKSYYNTAQTLTLATRCVALMPEALIQSLNLTEHVNTLNSSIATLEGSLSRSAKSEYTQRLAELDHVCDEALKFLTENTKSYAHTHIAADKEAGTLLHTLIKEIIPSVDAMGYATEMAKILVLYTELQHEKYQQALIRLRLSETVQHLIDTRNAFEQLYIEKSTTEVSKTEMPNTRIAAKAVLNALETVLTKIHAHKLISETAELETLESSLKGVISLVNKASK